MSETYEPGEYCKCGTPYKEECSCGAEWRTPREIELEKELKEIKQLIGSYVSAVGEAEGIDFIDDMASEEDKARMRQILEEIESGVDHDV